MTEPDAPVTPFVMVGDPDAALCVDDSCLLPGVESQAPPTSRSDVDDPQVSASQTVAAKESGSS